MNTIEKSCDITFLQDAYTTDRIPCIPKLAMTVLLLLHNKDTDYFHFQPHFGCKTKSKTDRQWSFRMVVIHNIARRGGFWQALYLLYRLVTYVTITSDTKYHR